MAGVISAETRAQLAAIARVRWRMFVYSLRTRRGSMELVSRIFMGLFFGFGGLGGSVGLATGAYYFVAEGRANWIAVLFWPVFLFWQLFPVMASAFSETMDPATLLRFPVSYPAYVLVRMLYGSLDVSTFLGLTWSLAIAVGVGIADVRLLPGALIIALSFALLNISLARLIFAWVERWLAQRRTREIFGIVLLLLGLSGQLIGPLVSRYQRSSTPHVARIALELSPEQKLLPPGAAGAALAGMASGAAVQTGGYFLLLCAYSGVFLLLLHLRLVKQYRGENLSETAGRTAVIRNRAVRPAWNLPGLSAPLAAVFEKELHYLLRSGPMLFTLLVPGFMLLVFRLGPGGSHDGGLFVRTPNLAFPVGAAYSLLLLTNLVYNSFGPDGAGLQTFFAAPVRMRDVVLAKNLAHFAVLLFEIVLVWVAVTLLFRRPAIDISMATITGIAFAAPVNFVAGNLLSLYAPKKVDYGVLGRQRASQTGVLASFGVQLTVVAIGVVVFLASRGRTYWLSTLAFVVLAAFAWTAYAFVLRQIDPLATRQRETLIAELCRS